MNQPYIPPRFELKAFNCPHCHAYAIQYWHGLERVGGEFESGLLSCCCEHCDRISIWFEERMIYPNDSGIVPPNPDLSEEIKADYNEAAGIVNRSPRGAMALLRLCVQKLCRQLGQPGDNLNEDIRNLVGQGLNRRIQQALDSVRVIGNNAVHPGELDVSDNREIAVELFKLINLIADKMITEPRMAEEIYNSLPQSARDGISRRDGATPS